MCIRDSDDVVFVDAIPLGATGKMQKNKLREALKDYKLPTACLLYTSDAADERSSVDLGGRRIIKKKNNRGGGSARGVR